MLSSCAPVSALCAMEFSRDRRSAQRPPDLLNPPHRRAIFVDRRGMLAAALQAPLRQTHFLARLRLHRQLGNLAELTNVALSFDSGQPTDKIDKRAAGCAVLA